MRAFVIVVGLSALSACAAVRRDVPGVVAEPDCGVDLVVQSRMGRPGVQRIRSGDLVPACNVPTAGEIEFACESADAADRPGDTRLYPDYVVSDATCAFRGDRTEVRCNFDIAAQGEQPQQAEAAFEHNFVDLSDEMVHDHLVTQWSARASCR